MGFYKPRWLMVLLRMIIGVVFVYGLAVGTGAVIGYFLGQDQKATLSAPPAAPSAESPNHPAPAPVAEHETTSPAVETTAPLPAEPKRAKPKATGWRAHAITIPAYTYRDKKLVTLIFDDMGVVRAPSQTLIDSKTPLTLAFLPYAPQLQRQVRAARANGHEVLLHLPMEAMDVDAHPGPNALMVEMDEAEILENLRRNLDAFDSYVGINNHMGSRFTQNAAAMKTVLQEIKARDLLFVDSMTTPDSKALAIAQTLDIPSAARDVFLDNEDDVEKIRAQFAAVEKLARKNGTAIAIGHPRRNTLMVLQEWLIRHENSDLMIVPLSVMIAERQNARAKKAAE